jgi:excisionase family DNA binding protein
MLDAMLDTTKAAEFLGVKPATVRKWKAERRLPFTKVGGTAIRFRQSELVKFLKQGDTPALRPLTGR